MMGAELLLNKQAFTGNEIVNNLTDDWWDKTAKYSDWAYKSWMPSAAFVPGSWYWTKVGTAINSKLGIEWLSYIGWGTGARDRQGRPLNIPAALASSVGIKISPRDVEEGFRIWAIQFDKIERELKSEMGRIARDRARGLISDREFDRQRDRVIDKLKKLDQRRGSTFAGEEARLQ